MWLCGRVGTVSAAVQFFQHPTLEGVYKQQTTWFKGATWCVSGACRPGETAPQSLRPASRSTARASCRADCRVHRVSRHSASSAARGGAGASRWAWSARRAAGGSRLPPRRSTAAGAGCAAATVAAVAVAATAAAILASSGRLPSKPLVVGFGFEIWVRGRVRARASDVEFGLKARARSGALGGEPGKAGAIGYSSRCVPAGVTVGLAPSGVRSRGCSVERGAAIRWVGGRRKVVA